jgi:hypothetical protein
MYSSIRLDGWSDLQLGRSTHREFCRSIMISRSEICLHSKFVLRSKGREKAGNSLAVGNLAGSFHLRYAASSGK